MRDFNNSLHCHLPSGRYHSSDMGFALLNDDDGESEEFGRSEWRRRVPKRVRAGKIVKDDGITFGVNVAIDVFPGICNILKRVNGNSKTSFAPNTFKLFRLMRRRLRLVKRRLWRRHGFCPHSIRIHRTTGHRIIWPWRSALIVIWPFNKRAATEKRICDLFRCLHTIYSSLLVRSVVRRFVGELCVRLLLFRCGFRKEICYNSFVYFKIMMMIGPGQSNVWMKNTACLPSPSTTGRRHTEATNCCKRILSYCVPPAYFRCGIV